MKQSAIFLDGAYLDKISEYNLGRVRFDYRKVVEALRGDTDVLRSYYYHCPPWMGQSPSPEDNTRYDNKMRFLDALRNIPRFEVKLGRLAFRGRTAEGRPIFVQKRVDVMMAIDMLSIASKGTISTVILVSGDNDFVPAVSAVKECGVSTILYHVPNGGQQGPEALSSICDEAIPITQDAAAKMGR